MISTHNCSNNLANALFVSYTLTIISIIARIYFIINISACVLRSAHLFENVRVSKNMIIGKVIRQTKEIRVKELLQNNGIKFIHNKTVQESMRQSRHRPDFVICKKDFKVVLEVDEHQHKNYCKLAEIKRMRQIHADFKPYNIVFIRYNPDKCVNNIALDVRENKLLELIKSVQCIAKLSAHYLFYDRKEDFVILEPMKKN